MTRLGFIAVYLLLALLSTGCVTAYGHLQPGQIEAMGKVKEAMTLCGSVTTPWGKGYLIVTKESQGHGLTTESTVNAECNTTIKTSGAPWVPELPAPTPAK